MTTDEASGGSDLHLRAKPMRISLWDVSRDVAIIVVLTYLVALLLVFTHVDVPASTYRAIDLLTLGVGGVAAGWFFSRKHGYVGLFTFSAGDLPRRKLSMSHAAAIAVASSLIVAAINIFVTPEDYKVFASPTAAKVLLFVVPLTLLMAWGKVYIAMQLGQWFYKRFHSPAPQAAEN